MTGTWQRTATLEPGRLAFTGDVGATEPHAHAALQLALNEGHRFHHLKGAGVGDVNFGLFTLVWDHLLGTFSYDPARRFTSVSREFAITEAVVRSNSRLQGSL